jgi:6,7-dimethyl-8-ribityllumazine synthase
VELEGSRTAAGCRFAVIVSRFNADVTEGLLRGAREALAEAGVLDRDITVVRVPGAFEIPMTARVLAETRRFDAVIALGCLIKGDTMHFEYIASAAAHGIVQASTLTGVPVTFGVLTTLTEEQAVERSGAGPDNKGREAARAAVEMATLKQRMAEVRA